MITAALFLSTGCSSPEKAVEGFLLECFAGDFDGAGEFALPEVADAFRGAADETGGIAPIRSGAEESELAGLVREFMHIRTERRTRSTAVVVWTVDWESLAGDASALPGFAGAPSLMEFCSEEGFRFLVVRENGKWVVAGLLPMLIRKTAKETHDTRRH